jgi:hypothetical protein
LLADPALSDGIKAALLAEWNSEIDARLNAECEGMGISDPLTAHEEGRLADEAGHANTALKAVARKQSPYGARPLPT